MYLLILIIILLIIFDNLKKNKKLGFLYNHQLSTGTVDDVNYKIQFPILLSVELYYSKSNNRLLFLRQFLKINKSLTVV